MSEEQRKPLKEIYMENAINWSKRSTCKRKSVGCVAVKDGRIIATGYNGSPSGAPHCTDIGCEIEIINGRECCVRTLHAEQAIISFCAKNGIILNKSDLYCTLSPCNNCAKLIINAGIKNVFFLEKYTGLDGSDFLNKMGINCEIIDLTQTKE